MTTDLSGLRIGLIGPGAIGELHARAVRESGATLAAVSGADLPPARAFADRHGIPHAYGDIDGMFSRENLDAVVVASPSHLHVPHTLAALAAGLDVLCEVPAALSLADGRRVAAAAGEHRVMIAHTLRFSTSHQRLHALMRGEMITHLMARRLLLRHDNAGWTGQARSWTDDVLWHHAAHLVDLALWLFDADTVEVCGAAGPAWPRTGKPMDVATVLRTPQGSLATLALSYHSREPVNELIAIGCHDTVVIDDGRLRRGTEILVDPGHDYEAGATFAQDHAFLQAVATGNPTAPSIADELRILDVLARLAATQSPK